MRTRLTAQNTMPFFPSFLSRALPALCLAALLASGPAAHAVATALDPYASFSAAENRQNAFPADTELEKALEKAEQVTDDPLMKP